MGGWIGVGEGRLECPQVDGYARYGLLLLCPRCELLSHCYVLFAGNVAVLNVGSRPLPLSVRMWGLCVTFLLRRARAAWAGHSHFHTSRTRTAHPHRTDKHTFTRLYDASQHWSRTPTPHLNTTVARIRILPLDRRQAGWVGCGGFADDSRVQTSTSADTIKPNGALNEKIAVSLAPLSYPSACVCVFACLLA